jgi:hypothetical protein
VVGGDGGLDGVLFELAGDERLAAWASLSGAADADLGGVDAQGDAFGRGVGEHVGQGVQPCPAGAAEPRRGEQRADLCDGAGDSGPVDVVRDRESGVRDREAQVDQG